MSSRPGDERLPGLWRRWKNEGDVQARDDLLMRYLYLVDGTLSRMPMPTMIREDYADLECLVTLRLFKKIESYDPARGVPFENYALPALQGEIKNYLIRGLTGEEPRSVRDRRKRGEEVPDCSSISLSDFEVLEKSALIEDPSPGPEELVLERLDRERLQLEIKALSPRDRLVMEDIYRLGLTYKEAAKRRGLSPQTIPIILRRATQRIRERLEGDE